MKAKRFSGQGGVSVVEAPIVLIVIAFIALGVLAFVQVFRSYQHLTSASRAAARYASKADYDPSRPNPSWTTRPSSDDVKGYAVSAAPELTASDWVVSVCQNDDKTCTANDNNGAPGQHVHVKGTTTVNDGAYTLISGLANGVGSFFGGKVLPDAITLRSEAVAAYE